MKKTRVEKIARRVILNGYRQAAGKKTKKIKWVKKRKNGQKTVGQFLGTSRLQELVNNLLRCNSR